MTRKLLLIGCGKMGQALLNRWTHPVVTEKNKQSQYTISVIDPQMKDELEGLNWLSDDISFYASIDELDDDYKPDVVVLAVKPQVMDVVLQKTPNWKNKPIFISIAAGKTLSYFEKHLGKDTPIIRTMPNTPSAIGKGATVGVKNKNVSDEGKEICRELFSRVGIFYWIKDEKQMDAVTAISGSGPAYVFYFIECLTDAGIEMGLPEDLAKDFAMQTIWGSAELAVRADHAGDDVAKLRENVTSPNGTTEAGLSVLMGENGLQELLYKTTRRAKERSEELG